MRPKGIMPPQNVSNNVQSTFNETNTDEKGYLAPPEFFVQLMVR